MQPPVHVGTSGWSYDHWTAVLYPPGLPVGRRLEVYGQHFATAELNASFYRWPAQRTFDGWRDRLPDGFQLAVKASRGLTHARRLREPEQWVQRMTASLDALGPRAGPLLLQLAPGHQRDDAHLDAVLGLLPDRVRVAVELRHPSWLHDEVFALLQQHGAAYVVMSGAHLPCVLRATAPLVYVRLHGPDPTHLYAGSYSDDDLHWWANRIGEWRTTGHEVYAYFNNDGEGHAVRNALRLRDLLPPAPLPPTETVGG
jgi:uncharacterized protein YecE (DUF72 family)